MPLEIEEGLTANLETMLKRGALDAIIVALPFDSTGVETRALFDEPFHLLVPNDHPLAKRKRVGSDDLTGEKLLLLRAGHCFRDQVLDACPGRRARRRRIATVAGFVARDHPQHGCVGPRHFGVSGSPR